MMQPQTIALECWLGAATLTLGLPGRKSKATPRDYQGNRVNKQKFNAKVPGRSRTAKTACPHSHCRTLLAAISHPNRRYSTWNLGGPFSRLRDLAWRP
jgi:hypothetical protein